MYIYIIKYSCLLDYIDNNNYTVIVIIFWNHVQNNNTIKKIIYKMGGNYNEDGKENSTGNGWGSNSYLYSTNGGEGCIS